MLMKSEPLHDYQKEVRAFNSGKPQIGDFVYYGGGKTYLSLQWLADLYGLGDRPLPALVLCPKNIVYQWGEQIGKHSSFSWSVVEGGIRERREALARPADLYVVNYGAIRTGLRYDLNLLAARVNTIIADESTYLKSAETLRFKLCQYNFSGIPRRAILSGRPLTEELNDLWSQMLFLDGGARLGKSYFWFLKQYFQDKPYTIFGKEPKPGAAEEIADRIKDICIYVPREKVAAQLPPRKIIPIKFELPAKVREQYNELKRNFRLEFESGAVVDTKWAFVKSNKLQQMCNGFMYADDEGERTVERFECLKREWLADSVEEILAQGPLIIWGSYRQVVFDIYSILEQKKIKCATYMGGSNEEPIQDFQSGQIDVLVLSQQAAFGGLNLIRARSAIYYSMSASGDMRDNSLARNYRLGSETHDQVVVSDLIAANTVEEVQYRAVEEKLNVSDELLRYLIA